MINIISFFKRVFVLVFSSISLLIICGYIYLYQLPKGPELTQVRPINNGIDNFVIYAHKGSQKKTIKAWTYKPKTWTDGDKIVFVMHGSGRNAEDYLKAWISIATENNFLIIAPEFENKFYNYTTNDYQEGNLFTYFGMSNPKEKWAFSVIENLFDHLKTSNDFKNQAYDLFGHSAGGQFVHRMVLLMPEARINSAIAANSGFYTFPNATYDYPYGFHSLNFEINHQLQKAYKKRLVILLGELDNNSKLGTFRTTEYAMEQGKHRLERGTTFFATHNNLKSQNNWPFLWKLDTVENVGHDFKKMSKAAVSWINN